MITKPDSNTITGYMAGYISQAPGNDLLEALRSSMQQSLQLFASVPADKEMYRYADGKWTIREVVAHIIDTERIFAYRALTFARHDKTELPGFEQDDYVPYSNANNRTLSELVKEYELVRRSSIALFESFTEAMTDVKGSANKLSVTPRIIGWMMAGHDIHHYNVLMTRYMN